MITADQICDSAASTREDARSNTAELNTTADLAEKNRDRRVNPHSAGQTIIQPDSDALASRRGGVANVINLIKCDITEQPGG